MTHPPTASDRAAWQVRVRGRVQGVGYRQACIDEATRLGLAGWVRNRGDGSVEAVLIGPADRLAAMRAWLGRGPLLARVDEVAVDPLPPPWPEVVGFDARPTA